MSSQTIFLISAGCIFGGALVGMLLHGLLPEPHLRDASKDTVKVGAGMIATLSALVLGLLVGSAKNTFDTAEAEMTQGSAKIILLDRLLADYGPETKAAREQLRRTVATQIEDLWPEEKTGASGLAAFERTGGLEAVQMTLLKVMPTTDAQRQLFAAAQQICGDLRQTRWLLVEQSQSPIPIPFLVVLLFWLTVLHVSFGMLAPRNATVVAVLLICALSVSGAIFMILEMSHPLDGMIKVSSAPMRKALEHLGQ